MNPWADWWALIELKTDEARDHEHEVAPGGAHSHGISQAPSHTHSYSDQDGINAPSPFRHTRPFASFTDAITPPVNGRAHGIFYVRALISVNNRPGNFAKSDDYWFRVGQ